MFGPELIWINELINEWIKIARSAVSKNRAERVLVFCGVSRQILKTWHWKRVRDSISSFFGDIFSFWTLSKKKVF